MIFFETTNTCLTLCCLNMSWKATVLEFSSIWVLWIWSFGSPVPSWMPSNVASGGRSSSWKELMTCQWTKPPKYKEITHWICFLLYGLVSFSVLNIQDISRILFSSNMYPYFGPRPCRSATLHLEQIKIQRKVKGGGRFWSLYWVIYTKWPDNRSSKVFCFLSKLVRCW